MAGDLSAAGEVMGNLDKVSEKNQHGIVIEFAIDRILHYVGVYLLAFIAAIAKISELVGLSLRCYPATTGDTSGSGDFISYANAYCWQSSYVSANASNTACGRWDLAPEALLKDPDTFKTIFRSMPYVMLIEALLYALPSIFWNDRVGAKLMCHLKFMRNLLADIHEACKNVPKGIYECHDAYDSDSYYLNGWNGFKPDHVPTLRNRLGSSRKKIFGAMSKKNDIVKSTKGHRLRQLLYGDMRDRHFFSMLCFENFSSLEHHPYILSVYKLTSLREEFPFGAFTGPKLKGMLRLMCEEKNFGGRFLVMSYFGRHAIGAFVSLITILGMCSILYWIHSNGWHAESFRCTVPHHDSVCMTCTIIRRLDMMAYVIINLIISAWYFVISILRLITVRGSNKRAVCHYFEEISDAGSAALDAAY